MGSGVTEDSGQILNARRCNWRFWTNLECDELYLETLDKSGMRSGVTGDSGQIWHAMRCNWRLRTNMECDQV
jgi:hypothetical protein